MDSNRGVDFIVLTAGKSGDGKPDSRNPQAWGLKRGEALQFTLRIDFRNVIFRNVIYSENRLHLSLFMNLDGNFY